MTSPRAGWCRHLVLALGLAGAASQATPLDVAPQVLGPRGGSRAGADAAAVGSRVVVTWLEETRQGPLPMAQTLDGAGAVVGAPRLLGRQRALTAPRVAGGASTALATWVEQASSGPVVVVRRLADDGTSPDAAPRALTLGADSAAAPAVAWLGTAWLVAWVDQAPGAGGSRVRALRVGADGALLDATALVVASVAHRLSSVSVAAAGGPALLAWEDWGAGTHADVQAARVSAAGALLDAMPVSLAATMANELAPAVGAMAAGYYVAWEVRAGAQADLRGQLLDAQGQPYGASTPLLATPAFEGSPRVTVLGTNYLVLASQGSGLYVSRVSASGALLDAAGTGSQYLFSAGSEGATQPEGGALVATPGGGAGLFLTRAGAVVSLRRRALLPEGRVTGAASVLPTGRVDQRAPRATATTSGHVVAWCEARATATNSDVFAMLRGPTGAALSPAPWPVTSENDFECGPALAWGGAALHLVWEAGTPRGGLLGRRFTETGTPLGTGAHYLTPQPGLSYERRPTIAWLGDESYVAYEALDSDAVWGARLDATAQPQFFGGEVALSDRPLAREPTSISLSGQYVVAWTEPSSLRARRFAPTGQPLDTPPLVLVDSEPGAAQARLATDGTAMLLSWAAPRDGRWQLFARRFAADGGALGAEVTLTDPGAVPREHALTFDGTGYWVAWVDARLGPGEVLARRLDAQGALAGPNPLRLVGVDGGNDDDRRSLSLSCSGGTCLAFFESSGLDDEGPFSRVRAQALPLGNQAPSALPATAALDAGSTVTITLGGSDPEGSPLAYRLVRAPRVGRLTWTPPTVTYAVDEGPFSRDEFFYVTDDGALQSAPARVVLSIRPTPVGVASDGGVDPGLLDAGVSTPDAGAPGATLGPPVPVTTAAPSLTRRVVRDASVGCSAAPVGLVTLAALAWLRRRRVRAGARSR